LEEITMLRDDRKLSRVPGLIRCIFLTPKQK